MTSCWNNLREIIYPDRTISEWDDVATEVFAGNDATHGGF